MKTEKERWKTRENERKINGVGESGHVKDFAAVTV